MFCSSFTSICRNTFLEAVGSMTKFPFYDNICHAEENGWMAGKYLIVYIY
jgi:hypothetical protein